MYSTDSQATSLIRSGQTVLVVFSMAGCSPCVQMSPIIDRIAANYRGRCSVIRMSIDDTTLHRQLGINSVPTIVLFKGGANVWSHNGLASEAMLNRALSQHC